ncbi:MAG: hypothetical protein Ct9H300mP8_01020 [Gammaproteobacteria bacterium]|nr:MAG: hypothetical protein Ct9H300mP8_01020 [Gammaproteobacteria bacterium]
MRRRDDGDGVADTTDAFSLDSEETTDTDGDGTGNNEDTDDDGDTILDTADVFPLIVLVTRPTPMRTVPRILVIRVVLRRA